MRTIHLIPFIVIAGLIRYFLITSKYAITIQNRIEVSTPLNSWKRVQEGAFMYANGLDPYNGDMYHQNPLILMVSLYLIEYLSSSISYLFIIVDLLTGLLLFLYAKHSMKNLFQREQTEQKKFDKEIDEIKLKEDDVNNIPFYVAIAYSFNPYSILNCVGLTTTVWSNFLLALFLFAVSRRLRLLACIALALETQSNFYPFVLILVAIISLSQNNQKKFLTETIILLTMYLLCLIGLFYVAYVISGSWKFIDSTLGFIIYFRDLQPNIGLFWYFFTEMFDHFRTLFLYTFQINATILYLFPLAFKLKDNSTLLATILLALTAIFRSYPCIGDIALYMALLPMWKQLSKLMSHNFIVVATLLVTTVLAPVVWHLWIYSRSANANFYFGVTLVFSTAQIFLITDLFFANIKREFCLRNGLTFNLDGKEARLALE